MERYKVKWFVAVYKDNKKKGSVIWSTFIAAPNKKTAYAIATDWMTELGPNVELLHIEKHGKETYDC